MKGIFNAVSAIILVIASVIATLVVVGFAFGLLPIGNKPEIQQVGTGEIFTNGTAVFSLESSSSCTLISAWIEGTNYTLSLNEPVQSGIHTYYLTFDTGSYIHPYNTYEIELTFRDGIVVLVDVYAPNS
ncbi:DUF973 family protein [Acidianus manzaensis]|uniref:DUF973 family protein n=1 Tax=Acidianus manzaensis TaxID=282676 RepID=UPI001F186D2C|nr:DUF973 family protein [Acidianus manzaensis]